MTAGEAVAPPGRLALPLALDAAELVPPTCDEESVAVLEADGQGLVLSAALRDCWDPEAQPVTLIVAKPGVPVRSGDTLC